MTNISLRTNTCQESCVLHSEASLVRLDGPAPSGVQSHPFPPGNLEASPKHFDPPEATQNWAARFQVPRSKSEQPVGQMENPARNAGLRSSGPNDAWQPRTGFLRGTSWHRRPGTFSVGMVATDLVSGSLLPEK